MQGVENKPEDRTQKSYFPPCNFSYFLHNLGTEIGSLQGCCKKWLYQHFQRFKLRKQFKTPQN